MMLVVLFGFAGLAIDGGRAYWERRILQNALDAGALAASDNYQDSQSISTAAHALATEYAANEQVYGAASSSTWTGTTQDLTWAGSSNTVHVVINVGTITTFDLTSTKTFRLAFMPVLGIGPNLTIGAHAQSRAKTGGVSGKALVTLSTATCSGGATNSLSTSGSNAKIIVTGGDVQSSGSTSNGGTITVTNGNFIDQCANPSGQDPPNGITANQLMGGIAPMTDPALPVGPLASYTSAQSSGSNVVLNPGIYASEFSSTGACYFLSAGVYQLNGGVNDGNTGQVMSNELRPPDEPAWSAGANYNNAVAANQFWGAGCKGSFTVASVASVPGLTAGWYGVVVTTTRNDYYPPQAMGGTSYFRESFPSTCHPIQVSAVGQGIKVTVNNVPGAQGYNVYFAYNAGASPCNQLLYGYGGNIPYLGSQTQGALGSVNATFNATNLTSLPIPANISTACAVGIYALNCAAATGAFGSANPPGDGAETAPFSAASPASSPPVDSALNGSGDRGNEHQSNYSNVTPGAVQLYFPASQCLTMSQGSLIVFGGAQYSWVTLYAPPANTCSTNTMSGQSILATIGTMYAPKWGLTVTGNGKAPFTGQLVVNSFAATGNGTINIQYDNYTVGGQGYSQISG